MDEQKQYNNDGTTTIAWDDSPIGRPRRPWGRISIILIILGTLLFVAGWVSGARGGRVYFENGLRVATFPLEEMTAGAMDLTFSNNFHTINVNATSDRVQIIPTSDSAPRVTASDDRRVTINERGGTLYVESRATSGTMLVNGFNVRWNRVGLMDIGTLGVSWNRVNNTSFLDFNFDISNFSFRNLGNTVRVYVPNSITNIDARSTSGSVRMEGVSTTQLNLRATSGSVSVDGGTHGNTHLQSNSGSVRMENASTTQLNMRATSGSVHVNGGTHDNIHLQSNSGSIRANGHFGDIDARTTSGGVHIQDYSTSHRNTDNIQLRSNSGGVRFSTRAPISDFNYDISVSSGAMRVDGARLDGRRASGGNGNTPITARTTSGSVHLDFSN